MSSDWTVDDFRSCERTRLSGVVFSHDFRCWLVPFGTPQQMDSRERGILFRVPGLGMELRNNERTRGRSGSPMFSTEAEIEGAIGQSSISPFPLEFVETASVVLLSDPPLPLDLSRLTELSQFDRAGADAYLNPDDRERIYFMLEERRRQW